MILDLPFSAAETWPLELLMGVQELEQLMPLYEPELTDVELDALTIEEARAIVGGVARLARHQRRRHEAAGLVGVNTQRERKTL